MVSFKEFLNFSVPPLQWESRNLTSTNATIPASPRKDELHLSLWSDFVSNAKNTVGELDDFDVAGSPLDVFRKARTRVTSEDQVAHVFNNIGSALSQTYNESDISFFPKDDSILLKPDLCVYKTLSTGDEVAIAAIEIKTPWAFDIPDGNIVDAYERQVSLASKCEYEDPFSKNVNDTKVIRAISQLWGYLAVNHLKYGVITTYSQTFFFRRIPTSTADTSKMEVTPAISVVDGLLPIFTAWYFFLTSSNNDFLYSSPYSSAVLSRKQIQVKHRYEPIHIDLSQIYFNEPFAFGASCSITTGKVPIAIANLGNKKYLFKVFDASKDMSAKFFFEREIIAYQALESIQGEIVPNFYCALIASGFVYILVLEKLDAGTNEVANITTERLEEAYKRMHSLGVIHHDVAKRNILALNDTFRIIDFGMSLFKRNHIPHVIPDKWLLDALQFESASRSEIEELSQLTQL
jgi:hypothetical protein